MEIGLVNSDKIVYNKYTVGGEEYSKSKLEDGS